MYKCWDRATVYGVQALFYDSYDLRKNFLVKWDRRELLDKDIKAVCLGCGRIIIVEPNVMTNYCNHRRLLVKVFNPTVWIKSAVPSGSSHGR